MAPELVRIGKLIRKARVAHGLTQGELAKKLGYSYPQHVSGWECGYSTIPLSNYKNLCRILDIPTATIERTLLRVYKAKLKEILH